MIIICMVIIALVVYMAFIFYTRQNRWHTTRHHKFLTEIELLEQERLRIRADLHEEIGPMLVLAFRLVEAKVNGTNTEKDILRQACKNLQHALGRMDGILANLFDERIIEKGLEASLRNYLDQYFQLKGVKSHFTCKLKSNLNEATIMELYRIMQEIINNSIKHADASVMAISIRELKGSLYISFADDSEAATEFNGICTTRQGLHNLEYRVHLLGGEITIEDKMSFNYFIEIPLDTGKLKT